MSLHILATGVLTGDPVSRTSATGNVFATATLRCHTEGGEYVFISCIAFGQAAGELLAHQQGGGVAVAGRTTLRTWEKNGETKTGLSVVVEQLASASAARRADAERRRGNRAAA